MLRSLGSRRLCRGGCSPIQLLSQPGTLYGIPAAMTGYTLQGKRIPRKSETCLPPDKRYSFQHGHPQGQDTISLAEHLVANQMATSIFTSTDSKVTFMAVSYQSLVVGRPPSAKHATVIEVDGIIASQI